LRDAKGARLLPRWMRRNARDVVVVGRISVADWRRRRGPFAERKVVFIKHDMPRSDDSARGEVEAAVTAVIRRVAEKDASHGARTECWWKSDPKGGRRHNSPLSSLPPFDYSR
jgi:Lon protease-like protein